MNVVLALRMCAEESRVLFLWVVGVLLDRRLLCVVVFRVHWAPSAVQHEQNTTRRSNKPQVEHVGNYCGTFLPGSLARTRPKKSPLYSGMQVPQQC